MRGLILGAVAGAAGTMALDMVSYADMAVRGRGSSDLPAEVVRRLALRAGAAALSIPSDDADEATKNRRSALGALSGYTIGIALGAAYGLLSYRTPARRGFLVRAFVLGALAMAASDVPSAALGATDPRTWEASGWISDIVPHAAYGLVTAAAFEAMASRPDAA
jgi:hypothetical protein